ncbi:hypothetical protein CYY_007516 [Polysphondylium violaceum]|uniref:histone acetyltransferase n=1 Tax=Polysphondylium violaceum TaxID=133409 RepID=A0A8J4UQU1_9MYCE|nr:hypothetical protein CYY_007516 [Polysphondylium violaceum]
MDVQPQQQIVQQPQHQQHQQIQQQQQIIQQQQLPPEQSVLVNNGSEQYHIPTVTPVKTEEVLGPEGGLDQNTGRGQSAKEEKQQGILRFDVITNDGSLKNLQSLMDLKNVFSKQLPKMPREYIVRLMFDKFHHSLLIIKRDNVIGGICFRPFREQGFIEIAFCAITSSEQVKGYGSFLMTHLKEHLRLNGIYHFLTFADNFAIEYFQKQGFTHEITLAKDKWKGFIQEYDGGSLMECVVHPKVTYLDIPSMVKMQRDTLNKKIREISTAHIVYPGLDCFKKGQPRIPIEQIKGIKESGWVSSVSEHQIQELQKQLSLILDTIKRHPDAAPFLKPVSLTEAPNYLSIIKDPVDLDIVTERLSRQNYYITKNIFHADLKRICNNCKEFNGEGSVYYEIADRFEKFIQSQINTIV